jgi:hypothetical protein
VVLDTVTLPAVALVVLAADLGALDPVLAGALVDRPLLLLDFGAVVLRPVLARDTGALCDPLLTLAWLPPPPPPPPPRANAGDAPNDKDMTMANSTTISF